MSDHELLLAISEMMDKKLETKLQPLRDDIRDIRLDIESVIKPQIARMDQKIEDMDQKFEARFEAMDQKFEARFEAMDQKFEARFEAMDQKFEARFEAIDQKFEDMDQKFEAKLQPLRDDIRDIRLDIENIMKPQIQLLVENYVPAARKYVKETAKIESLEMDVDILKKVVAEHSRQLQKIS